MRPGKSYSPSVNESETITAAKEICGIWRLSDMRKRAEICMMFRRPVERS